MSLMAVKKYKKNKKQKRQILKIVHLKKLKFNSSRLGYGLHKNSLKIQWLHKRESLQRFAMLLAWTTKNSFFN